ncbi:MAG: hypothetical protein PUC44_05170 [Eubacteriales bacterium]|nr:hypothetical protein [Eubacteriales bacterium]
MKSALPYIKFIFYGEIFITACCAIYIPWWLRVFRPNTVHRWTEGASGILLLFTTLFGILGVISLVHGIKLTPNASSAPVSGPVLLSIGIFGYLIFGILTYFIAHRPLTTELFLIIGWTILELQTLSRLLGCGFSGKNKSIFLLFLILAALFFNLILYVLYYKMEPLKAYYWAAAPLAADGAASFIFAISLMV